LNPFWFLRLYGEINKYLRTFEGPTCFKLSRDQYESVSRSVVSPAIMRASLSARPRSLRSKKSRLSSLKISNDTKETRDTYVDGKVHTPRNRGPSRTSDLRGGFRVIVIPRSESFINIIFKSCRALTLFMELFSFFLSFFLKPSVEARCQQ
jgi:hypothetical protein